MSSERKRQLKKSGRNTRKARRRRHVSVPRIVGLVVVAIVVILFAASVRNVMVLRQQQAELKAQNKKLVAQQKKLEKELKNVNDKNYIEKQARQQLKLIKPGETLYIVGDDDSNKTSSDSKN